MVLPIFNSQWRLSLIFSEFFGSDFDGNTAIPMLTKIWPTIDFVYNNQYIPAVTMMYPAKPGYSHCAEPGRSDLHFSTAGRVKQTLTPPSDKTESGIRLYSASALW